MHLSRRHQFPHGVTRRLSEAKDRIDSLSLDERCVFRLVELVLVSSLIGGWYASGGIESKPRRVATKVGILGSAFAVIWITLGTIGFGCQRRGGPLRGIVIFFPLH